MMIIKKGNNMTTSYDLKTENWISTLQGSHNLISVFEHAHEIESTAFSQPLQNLAFTRMFLPVLYRAYGLNNEEEWKALWEKGCFDKSTTNYLNSFCFDLLDTKKPFLQDPKLQTKKKESVNRLNFLTDADASWSSRNFIKTTSVQAEDVAIQLMTLQSFALNTGKGLGEHRSTFHASSQRGMPVLLTGKNLFQTFMLNAHPLDENLNIPQTEEDSPVWEDESPVLNDNKVRGYMQYLTRCSRSIKLLPNDNGTFSYMYWDKGNEPIEGLRDPFVVYKNTKDGYKPLRFSHAEHLWNNFKSFVISVKAGVADGEYVFANNENLDIFDDMIDFGYQSYGFYMDDKLTKYKMISEDVLPLSTDCIKNDDIQEIICQVVEEANRVGVHLRSFVYRLYKQFTLESPEQVKVLFWSEANTLFLEFMSQKTVEAKISFVKKIREVAHKLFMNETRKLMSGSRKNVLEYLYQKGNLKSFEIILFNKGKKNE